MADPIIAAALNAAQNAWNTTVTILGKVTHFTQTRIENLDDIPNLASQASVTSARDEIGVVLAQAQANASSLSTIDGKVDLIESTTIEVLTTSGTWTVPANIYRVFVTCVGGGAGTYVTTPDGGKCGAGASTVLRLPLSVTPGQNISYVVGAGGGGGGDASGGNTIFGPFAAEGGRYSSSGTTPGRSIEQITGVSLITANFPGLEGQSVNSTGALAPCGGSILSGPNIPIDLNTSVDGPFPGGGGRGTGVGGNGLIILEY